MKHWPSSPSAMPVGWTNSKKAYTPPTLGGEAYHRRQRHVGRVLRTTLPAPRWHIAPRARRLLQRERRAGRGSDGRRLRAGAHLRGLRDLRPRGWRGPAVSRRRRAPQVRRHRPASRSSRDYVAIDYQLSIYGITSVTPSAQTWEDCDRQIVCALKLGEEGEEMTGSAEGTRR